MFLKDLPVPVGSNEAVNCMDPSLLTIGIEVGRGGGEDCRAHGYRLRRIELGEGGVSARLGRFPEESAIANELLSRSVLIEKVLAQPSI